MRALLLVVAALAAVPAVPGVAAAFSSVPGHAEVSVKPVHKTKNGVKCLTGCEVKFKVRKAGGSTYGGAPFARPSLFLASVASAMYAGGDNDASRNATYDPESFKGLVFGDDIQTPNGTDVLDGKIKVDYNAPGAAERGLVPGARVRVVTAWKYYPSNGPHVYGTITTDDTSMDFNLPE